MSIGQTAIWAEGADLLVNCDARESGLIILSLASTVSARSELAAANIIMIDLADGAILLLTLIVFCTLNE